MYVKSEIRHHNVHSRVEDANDNFRMVLVGLTYYERYHISLLYSSLSIVLLVDKLGFFFCILLRIILIVNIEHVYCKSSKEI